MTDWRYLLPQSLEPPYVHVIGPEGGLLGANYDLRGECLETFSPLWSQEAKAMGWLKDVTVKGDSYPLVVWEIGVEHPLWPTSSMYLQRDLKQVRALIAKEGFLYLAARRKFGGFAGEPQIIKSLRRVGFHSCRAYYVLPSHTYPMHFVPTDDTLLMRYYLYHIASARSSKRKLMIELTKVLIQLKLDSLFPFTIPCFSIVAQRDN